MSSNFGCNETTCLTPPSSNHSANPTKKTFLKKGPQNTTAAMAPKTFLLFVLAFIFSTSILVPPISAHVVRGSSIMGQGGGQQGISSSYVVAPPANSTLDYLERALDGLDKAFGFFQRELKQINLDAVIGTRIVEATLDVLLRRLSNSGFLEGVPSYITARIRRLHVIAGEVSDFATPFIIENEPEYYRKIGPILDRGLFALNYNSRDVKEDAFLWDYNPRESMTEESSDSCLAEIFGTRTGKACDISRQCWKQMTAYGYNRYSLSHEILYLEVAEMRGCQAKMEWNMLLRGQDGLESLHDTFCANMLAEANLIADKGFGLRYQDLFMEQAALCGMLGYRQFFTSDWLTQILSWQDPVDGCYRWKGWPQKGGEDRVSDLASPSHHSRQKREEKRVSEGCLCHRTTVAASALAQYVRYTMEVWIQEQVQ